MSTRKRLPWILAFGLLLGYGCRPAPDPIPASPTPAPVAARAAADVLPAPAASSTAAPTATGTALPPTASPSPTLAAGLCSPLVQHPLAELPEIVSDPYNPPPPGKEDRHHGFDFSYYRRGERLSIEGIDVQAVLAGRVALAQAERFPYGNVVIIESRDADLPPGAGERIGLGQGESVYILYAHLQDAPGLSPDERVEACRPLGQVGKSGNAGIAHLHLETRLGQPGASFAPMAFYLAPLTAEEMANYTRWRTGGEFRHFDPMLLLLSLPEN